MPQWELTGLRPSWIEIELDGRIFSGREVKNVQAAFRDWKVSVGDRVLPGDEDRVWQAIKDAYPKFIIKKKKPGKPGVSIPAAWSFIRYVAARMKNRSLVDAVEAQRRADICSACPMRSAVLGCSTCKHALKMFVRPPQQLLPQPPEACQACGCWLPGKVWVPRDVLGGADEFDYAPASESFPGCWMRD